MNKYVLYTARFGDPGRFNFPEISIPDVDRFCFTDMNIEPGIGQMIPVRKGKFLKNDFYEIKRVDLGFISSEPIRRQRFIKICIPDEIFDNYEYSVYVDCKRPITVDFDSLLSFIQPDSDFVTRSHSVRDCAYDEGEYCKRKHDEENLTKQLAFYKSENFPVHNGLQWTTILFRRHTKRMKEFSKLWWEQLQKYSYRDQVALPYVAWKYSIKISSCRRPGRKVRLAHNA